jgi:hypothetical protein
MDASLSSSQECADDPDPTECLKRHLAPGASAGSSAHN